MGTVLISPTTMIQQKGASVSFNSSECVECHGTCQTCKNQSSDACYTCDANRNFMFNSTLKPLTWTAT